MKKTNKKGFTLAELLVVVAIIAVLVAIAIPIFTSQLEKAKEATDLANLRAAYAECTTAVLTGEANENGKTEDKVTAGSTSGSYRKTVKITQTKEDWTGDNNNAKIGNASLPKIAKGTASVIIEVDANGTVSYPTE